MLTLLSYIYWILWSIRKKLYETGILKIKRLPSPVISIGNITAGGTGKTPAAIALAKLLQRPHEGRETSNLSPQSPQGPAQRIAILTRGYKRRSQVPILLVSDGNRIISTPAESGDEPYLMASALRGVPVIVGADRYRSGLFAIDAFDTTLFILDDGYQHISLYRDIDILLIDATNPIGNGHLLPKGILREPLCEISRADCVIITRADEGKREDVEDLVRSYSRHTPLFFASYKATRVARLFPSENMRDVSIEGKKLLLFSGIGNPRSFRRTVERAGGRTQGEMIFPDHHWYIGKDIERVSEEASRLSVDAILTTEKDAVRLIDTHLLSVIQGKIEVLVLQVEMDIEKGFEEWIIGKIRKEKREGPLV